MHTTRTAGMSERRPSATPLHLLVSVDGLAEKHDEVRAVPKAWDRALATLEALAPRRKELNLRLAVNQTVLDADGAAHYRPLRARLAALGVKNHLVVAYSESATYAVERDQERLLVTVERNAQQVLRIGIVVRRYLQQQQKNFHNKL